MSEFPIVLSLTLIVLELVLIQLELNGIRRELKRKNDREEGVEE